MPDRERIVVGVDGSAHSKVALQWAYREAALRGADLEVIHVSSPAERASRATADAAQLTKLLVDEVGDQDDAIAVHHRLVEGPAAPALLEAARHADLIVVGSHGRQGYGGLRLGSVSQQIADHAPCPVVVVR